jgi:hypothetical protein
MYCPSCGVVVAQGLSYCNYCGAKLSTGKADTDANFPEVRPELLVSAMGAVFIFGLVAIAMLMGIMKNVIGLNDALILAFALLCFLIMITIEGVCIRLIFRRKRRAEEVDTAPLKGQATKELDAAQGRALPEPLPSVTEHTTRAFQPIPSDRTSK